MEGEVEEDREVRVMCFKCVDDYRRKFIPDENNISYVEFSEILKVYITI